MVLLSLLMVAGDLDNVAASDARLLRAMPFCVSGVVKARHEHPARSNGAAGLVAECLTRGVILRRLAATEACALAGAFCGRRVGNKSPSPLLLTQLSNTISITININTHFDINSNVKFNISLRINMPVNININTNININMPNTL